MAPRRAWSVLLAIGAATASLGAQPALPGVQGQPSSQQPVFRSSVELTSLDISAVDDRGRPVTDLAPEEFGVRVDGTDRRIVSAQWVALDTSGQAGDTQPPAPDGYSGNENATGGRLILLVVDQPNIRFGGTLGIRGAVNAFIDHLRPSDRTAVIGIGQGSVSTPFTRDRARLKRAAERLVGQYQPSMLSTFTITVAEAMDIRRSAPGVFEQVVMRECSGMAGPAFESCQITLMEEAQEKATSGAADGQRTMATLRMMLTALRSMDGPKTMLLVSEGFITDDQRQAVIELGALAAAARTSIYALKIDDQLFASTAEGRRAISTMDDRFVRSEGLQLLATAARGALFNVLGTGSGVFERVESEISGYYLLGVESDPRDRDGKAHNVRVEVKRKGITVRSRRTIMAAADQGRPKNPHEAVAAAMATPLPVAALPLRVATFSLQGPETARVQLLIHADVGTDYSGSRAATVAYAISDRDGKVVESQVLDSRLPPVMNGVPSPLQFTGGALVPPGEYTLKLAVGEGDRLGTVEHDFTAEVRTAGEMRVSDLMVGGPAAVAAEMLQPTVGYTVAFGIVHGYVEAYGRGARNLQARFELVQDEQADALLGEDVRPFAAGDARAIFSKTLPVRQLPPGRYLLRATLTAGGRDVQRLARPFEVAAPAVLMTSAESGAVLTTTDVFLPVADALLSRGFDRRDLSRADTLQAFRTRVAPSARQAFDAGVSALGAGDYPAAETNLKRALGTDAENSAVLTYLAAVFAAAGRDDQAAGAWQTALIDGSDQPQIYEWLTASLMRLHRLSEARAVLEEAVATWPADNRFSKPLAMVYATFGEGPKAVRMLERYLDEHPTDSEALQMGVEWIYHLKLSNAAAHSPADDLALARTYAAAYAKSRGSQQALVRQWLAFLEQK